MADKPLKILERKFKKLLNATLSRVLAPPSKQLPAMGEVQKVLVFRLDQRIGNGILLIPLLRAIRESGSQIELHFLVHHPVAALLEKAEPPLANRIWAYHQSELMRRPWRMLALISLLRNLQFDVVITSNNPDGFSLSQAIFGRLCKPRWLIGFDAKSGAKYYDVAVKSSNQMHYSDAMIDLWRAVDPAAKFHPGGLQLPAAPTKNDTSPVLIWLGATGNKILPGKIFAELNEQIRAIADVPVAFACGPADAAHLQNYPDWIRERTEIWKAPLTETATFFAGFRAFVSGDTGPMHLAVALGIPTLTIFIDSNIRQYGYNDGERHFSILLNDSANTKQLINNALSTLLR